MSAYTSAPTATASVLAPSTPAPSARTPDGACPEHPATHHGEVTDAPLPVLGRDVRVPLAAGGETSYAALDQAASAPVLARVWDELAAYAPYYGSVHRGAGQLSRISTERYERSRVDVARFLGCRPDDEVVFTRSTTDSLNLLAHALPPNSRVFVFETEHHAALLPWQRHGRDTTLLTAPRSPGQAVETLDRALRAAPDGPRLVCVTGASNVTGELWPVAELARVARRHGARTVLDAAQLVPHRPVNLGALDVDWVAFSGHKLYAPFGTGVLAGRSEWLRDAEPYLAGGGASRRVVRDTAGGLRVRWHGGAARHEAGSPNTIGAYAVAAACRTLLEAGFEQLVRRERRLLDRLLTGLGRVPGLRVLSLFEKQGERVGVVSFVLAGWESARLAAVLADEYGIGVRDGLFCAHPLLRVLLEQPGGGAAERRPRGEGLPGGTTPATGPEPSLGEGDTLATVRVSFGAGTPDEHIDRLLGAVRELADRRTTEARTTDRHG